jgi:Flp pilus assembly protein TadG
MRNLLHCRRGAAALATVVALTPLIGVVALGGEAASWYVTKQHAQNAADAAAYSGALFVACTLGASCNDTQTAVYRGKEFAAQNGFCNAGDTGYPGSACPTSLPSGITRSVAIATLTAWKGANGNFVQATVQQTQPTYLAGVLGLTTVQIGATAIAQVTTTPPSSCASNCGCMLQTETNPAGGVGLTMSNGVTVKLNTCGATVDAKGTSALSVTGGALLTAPSVSVAGGVSLNNGGKINSIGSCSTNCLSNTGKNVSDPYAAIAMPTSPGNSIPLPSQNWGSYTLSPGVWSGNVTLSNGSTYTMQPGVYFVNGGNFTIGSATVTGTGVTIVLTSGTVNIANGANVTLTAPTTGATAGIAFFGSRTASTSNVNSFAGGVTMKITGAIYFPTQNLSFSNGVTTTGGSPCTQIIAGSISIVGGTTLNSTACPAGVLQVGAQATTSVALVQ